MRITMLSFLVSVLLAVAQIAAAEAPAFDFVLKSASGENIRLSEYRGQVVVINFWSTRCGACRSAMPRLNGLYHQFHGSGMELLAISLDRDPSTAFATAHELAIDFPVLYDHDKKVTRVYDISKLPTTLLIDRDGRIRFAHRGFAPGVEDLLAQQIVALQRE